MEELQTIKGIGPKIAAALVALGVANLAALASVEDPEKLAEGQEFSAEDLAGWITAAKALDDEGAEGDNAGGASNDDGATNQPDKPRRRSGKTKSVKGPKRSIYLLTDEKGLGKRGAIVSVADEKAIELRQEGKARRATLADFRKAGTKIGG